MEHPDLKCGTAISTRPADELHAFHVKILGSAAFQPGVLAGPESQKREEMLHCAATIRAPVDRRETMTLRQLYSDAKKGEWPENIVDDLVRIFGSLDEVGSDVVHRLREGRFPLTMDVSVEVEQAPNPESRVTLSSVRDAMGLNQARLAWKFTKLEKRSALAFMKTIGKEFGRLGLGRVVIREWLLEDDDEWGEDLHGSFHHLGTTRMSNDPKRGVVDRNCRVHGVNNLYIAGGSVFATAGATNPTLTIVALSLRLADHLKKQLGF